jgi:hypothetical protein
MHPSRAFPCNGRTQTRRKGVKKRALVLVEPLGDFSAAVNQRIGVFARWRSLGIVFFCLWFDLGLLGFGANLAELFAGCAFERTLLAGFAGLFFAGGELFLFFA